MRRLILLPLMFAVVCIAGAKNTGKDQRLPPAYVPSGEHMYKQFCFTCHGADAKGHGPEARSLKTPPADLTTLTERHKGKFPYDYVSSVLLFGPGLNAHGSSEMPTWGPVFMFLDKEDEKTVRKRIKNLCDYLASLQKKATLKVQIEARQPRGVDN